MDTIKKHNVIIVGGGVAGISAALHLAERNIPFVLLEQKNQLGGRAYSLDDNRGGDEIDNGQHLMMGIYKNFLHLIEELGTSNLLTQKDALKIPFRNKNAEEFLLDTSSFSGKAGILFGLMKLKSLSYTDKLSIIRFVLKLMSGIIRPKNQAVSDLLIFYGQTERAIKYFWEPITLATLNAKLEDASDEIFITVLKMAFFGKPADSKLIIPNSGLSKIFEPFDSYVKNAKSELRYKTKVSELIIEDNNCKGVILNDGEKIIANKVISCLPPNVLDTVLQKSNAHLDNLGDFRFSSIISVYLWYDNDFIDSDFVSCIDTKIQWIFNRSRLVQRKPSDLKGHYALTISAANDLVKLSSEEIMKFIESEIHLLYPESINANLVFYKVIKDQRATPLLDTKTDSIRPDTQSSIDNLLLAGDWTNTGLPATLEGAALSGKKAAELISQGLDIRPKNEASLD